MDLQHLLSHALRVAVWLGLALAAMPLLRRSPSSARRLVLSVALGGALALPAVSAAVPAWHWEAPAGITSLRGRVIAESAVESHVAIAPSLGSAALTAASLPDPAPSRIGLAVPLLGLWASGALWGLARLIAGVLQSHAVVRRSVPAPSWEMAMARAASARSRVLVRATDEIDVPAVTGVFAPAILVPRGSDSWSEDRRHSVLLHELAHVRQQDCLVQILAQIACAFHWFDPLVWLAARRLRIERELAADDAVVAAGARPSRYAEDLLAIAGIAKSTSTTPPGVLAMADRSQLVARVTAIVSTTRARGRLTRGQCAVVSVAAALVGLTVACATPGVVTAKGDSAPRPFASASPLAPAAESTIIPELQRIADQELERALREWEAAEGTVLVLEPATGAVLANAGRVEGRPADVAIQKTYTAGSPIKAVTLVAALEEGVISPTDRFDCEHGEWSYEGKVIKDSRSNGVLTVPEMLSVSSNIGFAKVFDQLGWDRLAKWFHVFHFGAPPGIDGAATGGVPDRIGDKPEGAFIATGGVLTASPLQVAAAYAALANRGLYVAPTLSRGRGNVSGEQIMKPETARVLVTMLEGVVYGERGTGRLAQIAGVRVAGKTGTAEWDLPSGDEARYASFVGIVPSTAPRFVILVGVERSPGSGGDPKVDDAFVGSTVAAPVFARVASRALAR